ncbi:group XIIA secretory phospholipase A2-like [Oscarella lobularis]|uniref:group XIIA secretory phospholipase A2-like n=1 Tax=Oscarella lobularis TaxID=121494 RepID=UPI00331370B2
MPRVIPLDSISLSCYCLSSALTYSTKMLTFAFVLVLLSSSLCKEVTKEKEADFGEMLGAFSKLMGAMEGGEGCKYKCKNGNNPMPRPDHKPTSNGCGSSGITVNTKGFPGLEKCCDTHDYCYDTCGENRNDCDGTFERCMTDYCDDRVAITDESRREECQRLANVMGAGVSGFGCQAYLESQAGACNCSDKKGDL